MKLRTSGQECSLDGGFELGSPHRLARRGVFFGVCDARSPHGAPAYLAQVVEHLLHKQKVGGLIPSRRTFFRNIDRVIGGGCLGLWFQEHPPLKCVFSSDGRMSAAQAEGRRLDSVKAHLFP